MLVSVAVVFSKKETVSSVSANQIRCLADFWDWKSDCQSAPLTEHLESYAFKPSSYVERPAKQKYVFYDHWNTKYRAKEYDEFFTILYTKFKTGNPDSTNFVAVVQWRLK